MNAHFKNFFKGFGSLFDLFPPPPQIKLRKTSTQIYKNDREALHSDWVRVGNDITKALNIVKEDYRRCQKS